MTHAGDHAPDPFRDPSRAASEGSNEDWREQFLSVGRDASLSYGDSALGVLDPGLPQKRSWPLLDLCGLNPHKTPPALVIPFHNVLWASVDESNLAIHYAHSVRPNVVRPACIAYPVDKFDRSEAIAWIDRMLNRAYGTAQRRKRIKVLINPFGGKGRAQKWYLRDIEPIFAAARCDVDVERTQYSGHAVEIAQNLDTNAFDVVASCSGDGLPHEVFNGLAKKPDATTALSKVAVVQLPCGSGNAMSWNLNGTDSPSLAALAVVKGLKTPMDLASITQGDKRTLSFLSQAVGIVAETDLGTEHLRWMGDARFTYGFLIRLLGKTIYPCDVAVKVVGGDKASVRRHCRSYVESEAPSRGSMDIIPIRDGIQQGLGEHPGAEQSNGLPPLRFGTVRDELPSDWHVISLPTLGNCYAEPGVHTEKDTYDAHVQTFFDMPTVNYRKVEGFRVTPYPRGNKQWSKGLRDRIRTARGQRPLPETSKEGYIAIDGETVPFEPYQVEVHRGLGTVLSRNGKSYEAPLLE
ncbi:MAG: sphinganine kinase lcb4 [Alyxoria varia]|nr:MAG: sphinganine kinase lcb4 [Alyxoria varia]